MCLIIPFSEDLDKANKDKKKLADNYENKIRDLNEKVNNLQTNLENTKTELSHMHKQTKQFNGDKGGFDKEIDFLKRKVKQQEDKVEDV